MDIISKVGIIILTPLAFLAIVFYVIPIMIIEIKDVVNKIEQKKEEKKVKNKPSFWFIYII